LRYYEAYFWTKPHLSNPAFVFEPRYTDMTLTIRFIPTAGRALMGGQTTGPVALPQLSSARDLSKCWKSLRNLLAALLSPDFQTAND